MATLVHPIRRRAAETANWLERLNALLAEELAPRPLRYRTALRLTTIATVGLGLTAICHVSSDLGALNVWTVAGAGPMLSFRKAGGILLIEGVLLALSVVMARLLSETPWLMLPFLFAFTALFTFIIITRNLGGDGIQIQTTSLYLYYDVIFAPRDIGWAAAGAFGGLVIAYGVVAIFDNWLWPDSADTALIRSLGESITRQRFRLVEAARFYLGDPTALPPGEAPPISDMAEHLALLDRATVEGTTSDRRAEFLAAITRVARIHVEVDRVTIAAREDVPSAVRAMLRPEIASAINAISEGLDELAHGVSIVTPGGAIQPSFPLASRAQAATDALNARVTEVRPAYISNAGAAEIANFASFIDCLAALALLVAGPQDEPPTLDSAGSSAHLMSESSDAREPRLLRYCFKTGLCVVVGYLMALSSHRPELWTLVVTIVITALPTYGAALRKMVLRVVGAGLGGLVSLLTIIVVTPNFETLPSYLLAIFMVLYISAYLSLSSGRVAYAGKQIGTTFVIVFAGLSPQADVYAPLWRIWGILLGIVVVTIVFVILWPEYARDSLLPRLRKVMLDALALVPGAPSSSTVAAIHAANSEAMRVLQEILVVADDAQLEGRSSNVDYNSVVQAAGTLRRIASQLTAIAMKRIGDAQPRLEEGTESAREAVFGDVRARIEAWLAFFEGIHSLGSNTAITAPAGNSHDKIVPPLEDYSRRLEAHGFAQLDMLTVEQRRATLAELHSLRRIEFLMSELDRYLSRVVRLRPA